jgi:chorismate mutase
MAIVYKVFVNHLPAETKFKGLQKYLINRFRKFQLFKSKNRGKNRSSYAVVTVFKEKDYESLLNDPFKINGEACEVSPFISEEERERMVAEKLAKRVYINDLKDEVTKDDLRVIFELYGEIEELYLKENYDEKFETKYAFVTYSVKESASKCLQSSTKHTFMGQVLVMIDS